MWRSSPRKSRLRSRKRRRPD